jgi:PAS domain S-box-containing protein
MPDFLGMRSHGFVGINLVWGGVFHRNPSEPMKRKWTERLLGSQGGWTGVFSRIAALLGLLFGASAILVEEFHLQRLSPSDIPASDGLCFVLLALCLGLQFVKASSPTRRRLYRWVSVLFGLATVSIALVSFLRALSMTEAASLMTPPASAVPQVGMPRLAALDFMLLGAAFALPDDSKHDQVLSAQLLAAGAFVFGLFGMLTFAFGTVARLSGLPIEAVLLVALSLGLLFLHPDRGVVAEVFTNLSGGVMARRLLPIAIVIPVVLDWWRYEAQQYGLLSPETGTMLMVMMAIILLLYEMIVTAQLLNRGDASRRRIEEALAEANENLEAKVTMRSEQLNKANERLRTELAERKLAEEKLRLSERRLRVIVDQIPAAVWTADRDLRILSLSGAGLAAANLRAEDLVGRTVPEFLGTADEKAKSLAAHRAALRGHPRSYEIELAGRSLAVHLEPLHDSSGRISGIIAVALDVTEEKRAQESIAKLAAIVESSQDAIMGTSLEGTLTSWNRGAEQMYGHKAEEVLGRHASMTAPPNRQREISHIFEEVRSGAQVPPFETLHVRKDGRPIDVSVAVSPVKDPAGKIVGLSVIAHDIGDRKRVERELRKLSARLLKMQDEDRRNIARELHDGAIQGLAASVINLSMVKESTQLPPESGKMLEEALKLTTNAVREIRTFSYLLHPPLLDETGLASALRWYVEGYSRRSGIEVDLNLPKNGQQIGKEVELTLFRIVQEALANIHRHSGGHKAGIHIEETPKGLTLTVSDDGHGMDTQTLKKVRSEGAALGVGIAGMKERLRQLGGTLEISSSGSGTVVTASLPVLRGIDETVAHLDRR